MSLYPKEKHKMLILLMWITALLQASITMYLPALPIIAIDLHVSPEIIKSTISMYLLGFGSSPIIYGPLSDRYGRKPLLLFGIYLAFIGYLLNSFAHTINIFLLARLIQGIGCGSILILGRTIIRDSFSGVEYSSASSHLTMGFAIGFGLSPLLGGYLVKWINWRADFICLTGFSMLFLILVWKLLPETLTIRRNQESFSQFLSSTIDDYKKVLINFSLLKYLLAGLFAYGVIITYSVMTPFLIQTELNVSSVAYGWLALLISIPHYYSASSNRYLVLKIGVAKVFSSGVIFIVGAGIIMMLFSMFGIFNLVSIIIPMMIAAIGQSLIFSNTVSSALEDFSLQLAGKASAMFSSLQMLLISLLSAIVAILPNKTILSLAMVLISLGMLSGSILHFCKQKM